MARTRNPVLDDFLMTIQDKYAGGFQPYAAGDKRYGASGRDAPNIGPTSNLEGYAERDRIKKAKRNYMLKAMKAKRSGKYMTPEALRTQNPGTYPI